MRPRALGAGSARELNGDRRAEPLRRKFAKPEQVAAFMRHQPEPQTGEDRAAREERMTVNTSIPVKRQDMPTSKR